MKRLVVIVIIGILFLSTLGVFTSKAQGEEHSVTLSTPAINGNTVDFNGGATFGENIVKNGISWDWGDGTIEAHAFPNSHFYTSDGEKKLTVTVTYKEGNSPVSDSATFTVGEGVKSGGFALTIDNIAGGGSVSYSSSIGDGSVASGDSVELYLAAGDPVWGITATPDFGSDFENGFDAWTVSGAVTAMTGQLLTSQYNFAVNVGEVDETGVITATFAQIFFNTPAINGKTVDINGGAIPGDKIITNGINWDWGDGTPIEQNYFPNSHTYTSAGTYTITVTANYENNERVFTAFRTLEVTVGEGVKSGGFTLTIDNTSGGGSVSYSSSIGDGSVASGDSVELYLAEGDPVWGITGSPGSGMQFAFWAIPGRDVNFMGTSGQTSNPVDISVNGDGVLAVNFVPISVVPEYLYGALLAMAACLAAFIVYKKPWSLTKLRSHN